MRTHEPCWVAPLRVVRCRSGGARDEDLAATETLRVRLCSACVTRRGPQTKTSIGGRNEPHKGFWLIYLNRNSSSKGHMTPILGFIWSPGKEEAKSGLHPSIRPPAYNQPLPLTSTAQVPPVHTLHMGVAGRSRGFAGLVYVGMLVRTSPTSRGLLEPSNAPELFSGFSTYSAQLLRRIW